MASFAPTRRRLIGSGLAALVALALAPRQALAAIERIGFDDLYGKISVLACPFPTRPRRSPPGASRCRASWPRP